MSYCTENQSPLEVEFAPYQKIPREKQRKDAKMGTIDRDPEYLAFLEELSRPKEVRERRRGASQAASSAN